MFPYQAPRAAATIFHPTYRASGVTGHAMNEVHLRVRPSH